MDFQNLKMYILKKCGFHSCMRWDDCYRGHHLPASYEAAATWLALLQRIRTHAVKLWERLLSKKKKTCSANLNTGVASTQHSVSSKPRTRAVFNFSTGRVYSLTDQLVRGWYFFMVSLFRVVRPFGAPASFEITWRKINDTLGCTEAFKRELIWEVVTSIIGTWTSQPMRCLSRK